MMNNLQIIDCMLDADKRLQEGWGELKAIGKNDYCEVLLDFISLDSTPTIINLFNAVRESSKSNAFKIFALEALASDLSVIATDIGVIGEEVPKNRIHSHSDAMRIRSQAKNEYCSDDEFLSMINGESK